MSRVAVIIVNYNGGRLLHECLTALAAQSVSPSRVVVVDNASTDGSIDECATAFPGVEFHRLSSNVGFAKANNIGVGLVPDCEWIALLNPDAFAEPRWIQSFHEAVQRFPDTDAFASCMLSAVRRDVIDGAGDAYRVDGLAWPRFQGEAAVRLPKESEEVFSPCAGAGFYRRATFLDVGGFNERYFCYYEDVDLGFRFRLMGSRCRFLPTTVVYHVGSALTGGVASDFSTYHVHRNVVWNFLRNMPGHYFWMYLPAHVTANLVSVALFVRKGKGRTILRAKWHAIRGLPEVWRERQAIQRRRRVPARAVVAQMQRGNAFGSVFRRVLRMASLSGRS